MIRQVGVNTILAAHTIASEGQSCNSKRTLQLWLILPLLTQWRLTRLLWIYWTQCWQLVSSPWFVALVFMLTYLSLHLLNQQIIHYFIFFLFERSALHQIFTSHILCWLMLQSFTVSVQWKRLPTSNEPPPPRAYHSMTSIGFRFLLFGGFDGKNTFGDLWWLVPEGTVISSLSEKEHIVPIWYL